MKRSRRGGRSAGRRLLRRQMLAVLLLLVPAVPLAAQTPCPSGPPCIDGPLPQLFPAGNWWNLDISVAPLDPGSAGFISFIGSGDNLHPDFGGEQSPGSVGIWGLPYVVVAGSQPKQAVYFEYWDESDGGFDPSGGTPIAFYPIPEQAKTEPHWIEGGQPGNENPDGDRHMLIVDVDNSRLYELYDLYWTGSRWEGGSGAFFDLTASDRRPPGWTSADAAGLAILPGLVRYDEACGAEEIDHAFRVTVHATPGYYVWPASHVAGGTASAPPLGARLRLKAATDISATRFPDPCVRRVFRAMKKYGLIVADNGSDMYVTGSFDLRWPARFDAGFHSQFGVLEASDFEVVKLGWQPLSVGDVTIAEGTGGTTNAVFSVMLAGPANVGYATVDGTATAGSDYVTTSGTLSFPAGTTLQTVSVPVIADPVHEPDETFHLDLSPPAGVPVADARGTATILDDDPECVVSVEDAVGSEGTGAATVLTLPVRLAAACPVQVSVGWTAADGTAHAPGDYAAASGTITFAPGATSSGAAVTVVGDATPELDETVLVTLSGAVNSVIGTGQATGTILDDDALSATAAELSHGVALLQDLADAPGPVADVDLFRIAQNPRASYEVVVDAASGDVSPVRLERIGSDGTTVLEPLAQAIGLGPGRSLRWRNLLPGEVANQTIRVRSRIGGCATSCGADDGYRIRSFETTAFLPRFNNAGSQITVLVLQNLEARTASLPVQGTVYFWSPAGTLLGSAPFSLAARATLVLNTTTVPGVAGRSGALTIAHDGAYGALAGKAVSLEPSTGFSFDTPLTYRP